MLETKQLTFAYGEVVALRDVSIKVPERKIVSVMGRNGVGKTTLLRNLVGLERPRTGSITLSGRDLTHAPAYKRASSGIGYVPQGRQIFPRLTVEENLRIGLSARSDGITSVPDDVYDLFPICKEMGKRMGGDLSGGQQQQLAIGRALAGNPRVLILDEPTEGIQPNIIQEIGRVLRLLVSERGMTILLVEQYLDFVKEFSELFYVMNRGEIVAEGQTKELTEEIISDYLSV